MADLILAQKLNLCGTLRLTTSDGGKVKVGADEVLVQVGIDGTVQGSSTSAVLQPPPPATPLDVGTEVKVIKSFNSKVTANGKFIVALGVCLQGGSPPPVKWPGMVLLSTRNLGAVTIEGVPINVLNDSGVTLPNGGAVTFDQNSGQ